MYPPPAPVFDVIPGPYVYAFWRFKSPDKWWMVSLNFGLANTGPVPVMATIASSLDSFTRSAWRSVLSNDVTIDSLQAFYTRTTPAAAQFVSINKLGGVNSPQMPCSYAAMIRKVPASGVKTIGGRARMRISGVPRSFQNEGILTTAAITSYTSLCNTLLTPITGTGFILRLVVRAHKPFNGLVGVSQLLVRPRLTYVYRRRDRGAAKNRFPSYPNVL